MIRGGYSVDAIVVRFEMGRSEERVDMVLSVHPGLPGMLQAGEEAKLRGMLEPVVLFMKRVLERELRVRSFGELRW